jgi:hypothetical protein
LKDGKIKRNKKIMNEREDSGNRKKEWGMKGRKEVRKDSLS